MLKHHFPLQETVALTGNMLDSRSSTGNVQEELETMLHQKARCLQDCQSNLIGGPTAFGDRNQLLFLKTDQSNQELIQPFLYELQHCITLRWVKGKCLFIEIILAN